MNGSNTQTETANTTHFSARADDQAPGLFVGRAAQVNIGDKLPPPPEEEHEKQESIDINVREIAFADEDSDGGPNPHWLRTLFEDPQWTNGDHILIDIWGLLKDILLSHSEARDKAFAVLKKAMKMYQNCCDSQHVEAQLLTWASSGYTSEPVIKFFDQEGKPRAKLDIKDDKVVREAKRLCDAEEKNRSGVDPMDLSGSGDDAFPSDMNTITKLWESGTKPLEIVLEKPRAYKTGYPKECSAMEDLNTQVARICKKEGKGTLSPIPYNTLVEKMIVVVERLATKIQQDAEQAKEDFKSEVDMEHNFIVEGLAARRMPEVWAELWRKAVWAKGHIVLDNINDKDLRYFDTHPALWPVRRSEQFKATVVPDSGNINSGAPIPARPHGPYQVKFRPGFVRYENKERKIGAIRDCSYNTRGNRVERWQVLVQVSEENAPFLIYHIVPASKLAAGVVDRYKAAGTGTEVSQRQGKRDEIDRNDIERFYWCGLAYAPKQCEQKASLTYVLGGLGQGLNSTNDFKFWTRSLLGSVFRIQFVDEQIAVMTDAAACKRPPRALQASNSIYGFDTKSDESDDEEFDEPNRNDGVYHYQGGKDWIIDDTPRGGYNGATKYSLRSGTVPQKNSGLGRGVSGPDLQQQEVNSIKQELNEMRLKMGKMLDLMISQQKG